MPMKAGEGIEAEMAAAGGAAAAFGEAVGLAGAALERLARGGEAGDRSGHERVAAVMAQRAALETALIGLVVALDEALEDIATGFEAVKRRAPARGGLARRARAPVAPDPAALHALGGAVDAWLGRAGRALALVFRLRDTLRRCHAGAEMALEGVVARRMAALGALEAAQKGSEDLRPGVKACRLRLAGAADAADRARLESERAAQEEALSAALRTEEGALLRYRGEDDLAALFDLYMNAVNGQIGAGNAMIAKLSADGQRGALLYAAIASFAPRREEAPAARADARIGALLEAVGKGFLNHAEMARHRALADDAFARRFGLKPPGEGSG